MLHCCFGADASSSSPLLHCSATAPGASPLLLPTTYPQLPGHMLLFSTHVAPHPRLLAPASRPAHRRHPASAHRAARAPPQTCHPAPAVLASQVSLPRRGEASSRRPSSSHPPPPGAPVVSHLLVATSSRAVRLPPPPPPRAPTAGRPCHLLTLP